MQSNQNSKCLFLSNNAILSELEKIMFILLNI